MSLKKIFFTFILLSTLSTFTSNTSNTSNTRPYCIMLHPAGDAQYTGRALDNHFERGIALQCAQFIKQELEQRLPHIQITLTRDAGQLVMPLAHAQFANRLGVDLFISLHFYKEKAPRSQLYLYSFSYGNDHVKEEPGLRLVRHDAIYRVHHVQTRSSIHGCYTALSNACSQNPFDIHQPQAFPHAQLIGINAPAFAYEVGLTSNDDWSTYALLLCQAVYMHIPHTRIP